MNLHQAIKALGKEPLSLRHRVGDVWKLADGRYLVFDFDSCLEYGWMFDDGQGQGTRYLQGFRNLLRDNDAQLIARGDGRTFHSNRESLDYLERVKAR